jgi:hypothetical protein
MLEFNGAAHHGSSLAVVSCPVREFEVFPLGRPRMACIAQVSSWSLNAVTIVCVSSHSL